MIKPFGNNILVKPASKLQIASTSGTGSLCEYGEVVEVGQDVVYLQKGDTIGFVPWGIKELDYLGTTYYFVPEDSKFILGTLNG